MVGCGDPRQLWSPDITGVLDDYERFLKQPDRWLYVPRPDPYCGPIRARDRLQRELDHLPGRARSDLHRIVRRLDAEFRRRTLPDPDPDLDEWQPGAWWQRRLLDGDQER
ncbi:hypothetical protein F8566_22555 [Actinomadura rudentiformis]|uniref:Uncharacterized protein n=1 Tax=Actinomadura rudentiformis TaxID=359158 RepID=A0A6H9YMK0_9ACTN|nr:hypothetical protein F8566_22555 [Actinomadura rudentiformis]